MSGRVRGCGAAAEIETSRVLKHCSARLFPEAGLSLREKRASQNCAPTLVSSPCCLISHVTFQRWSVPVRAVSERGGEWGFRGSPFARFSRHTLPRLRDGTAPQISTVSLDVLLFFSALRIVFFVAREDTPRDEKYYSQRDKMNLNRDTQKPCMITSYRAFEAL